MTEDGVLIELTAGIVVAHVSNNAVAAGDLPTLIQNVHRALASTWRPAEQLSQPKQPAVSIRASVKPDYVVCLECGRKQTMLRRHLKQSHGRTPEEYRRYFDLPSSYPMVAPNYSARRRDMALSAGLGQKAAPVARKRLSIRTGGTPT